MPGTRQEAVTPPEEQPERSALGCRPVFVFSGQGSQWAGMGRVLLERSPVCRSVLEACDVHVRRLLGWSLLEALTREEAHLGDIAVSCPAIVSMELALAALWRSWGVEPAAVMGHSIGEVAAAHVAGALSLQDAMRAICHQGHTIARIRGQGAMAMVGLPWARALEALPEYEGRVWRAIHASPEWTVLAAEPPVLEGVLAALKREGVPARRIDSEVAAHWPKVDPLREDLRGLLSGLSAGPEQVPIVSTVTGGGLAGERFDADYWVRNLAEPVLFRDAVDVLLARGHDVFLEVSPHPLVKHSLESCMKQAGCPGTLLASMRRGKEPFEELEGTLHNLKQLGARERRRETSALANVG